jgi:hypothetical protein
MAFREGQLMKEEYRTAAALHHKMQGALAGHVSSRGGVFKERMLMCGSMAAKCALDARNPHISVCVRSSGRLEYRGSVNSPRRNTVAENVTCSSSQSGRNSNGRKSPREVVDDAAAAVEQTTIDLHGLYVKEAIEFTASVLDYYYDRSAHPRVLIRFIVGRGVLSQGGVCRLGPAIKKYLDSEGVYCSLTEGELRVRIQ